MRRTLTSKRRTTGTKAGGSCNAGLRRGLLGGISICAALLFLQPGGALFGEKKIAAKYALIAGTVFRDSGLSLAGAELVVTPVVDAKPEDKHKKLKAIKVFSDTRGEFAIRVPAQAMRYTVTVRAAGYRSERKEASIQGDERVDLFFRLEPSAP